jgi:hypothetical protein
MRGPQHVGIGIILAAALSVTLGRTTLAHHSFAMFDTTKEVTLAGTIKEFQWTNPHTWIWLEVHSPRGDVETWGIEGSSPNNLAREGWNKSSLSSGDTVTLVIHPLKDGSKGGSFVSAVLPSGRVLKMGVFSGSSAR